MNDSVAPEGPAAEKALQLAPVVWLLGKVQSGKSSIVRELTQSSAAEVGSGFRACTRTARVFDFPQEAPIIRFLDTRGLGEIAYDPNEDIAFCEGRSHLILAVVKALDTEQHAVLEVVRAAKARHPGWPVVVAQTSLHEAYPAGARHVLPYPFSQDTGHDTGAAAKDVPENLARALDYQRALFRALPGGKLTHFCPIDFTQSGDGFEPVDYGRAALTDALMAAAPAAVAVALAELPRADGEEPARKSNAHILGFALAAGASDALPLAGVVAVPVIQAAMLRQLAKMQDVHWDRRAYAEFAGALGTGTLARVAAGFGVRQIAKLIPVYGQTAGAAAAAAASFAATYAMGKAASYFLMRRRQGRQIDDLAAVYSSALHKAFHLAKERDLGASTPEAKP